jgi:creatinine amidohydrolase
MTREQASPVSPGGPRRGPLTLSDPNSPNYSPSGSFGDPTLASPEKGRTILAAIVADLMEAAA